MTRVDTNQQPAPKEYKVIFDFYFKSISCKIFLNLCTICIYPILEIINQNQWSTVKYTQFILHSNISALKEWYNNRKCGNLH